MGAKTWMIAYADGDPRSVLRKGMTLDREATDALGKALFPGDTLGAPRESNLGFMCPQSDEVVLGAFPGLAMVAAFECIVQRPEDLPRRLLDHGRRATMICHGMFSSVDAFAFGLWRDGVLVRWLSLSPDDGIVCDIGERLPFEQPYWQGAHPVEVDAGDPPYPLPFHPLELGEAALREYFGYQLEGIYDPSQLQPESIPMLRYARKKRPWWAFWR